MQIQAQEVGTMGSSASRAQGWPELRGCACAQQLGRANSDCQLGAGDRVQGTSSAAQRAEEVGQE